MPLTTNRGDHIRVFRPKGSKYARARDPVISVAIAHAMANFILEFGYVPKQEDSVIEILGTTGDWTVDFFEVVNFDLKPRPKEGQS
jgi:hypothetical protein